MHGFQQNILGFPVGDQPLIDNAGGDTILRRNGVEYARVGQTRFDLHSLSGGVMRTVFTVTASPSFFRWLNTGGTVSSPQAAGQFVAKKGTSIMATGIGSKASFKADDDAGVEHFLGGVAQVLHIDAGGAGAQWSSLAFQVRNDGTTVKGDEFAQTECLRIDRNRNVMFGGITAPGTSATNTIVLADGVAPSTSPASAIQLYSTSGELRVRDSAGNITLLSPHNFDGIPGGPGGDVPFSYYSKNAFIGKEMWVDWGLVLQELQKLVPLKKFFHVRDLPPEQIRDWDAEETRKRQERQVERAAWLARKTAYDAAVAAGTASPDDHPGQPPPPYVKQPEPAWITARKPQALNRGSER